MLGAGTEATLPSTPRTGIGPHRVAAAVEQLVASRGAPPKHLRTDNGTEPGLTSGSPSPTGHADNSAMDSLTYRLRSDMLTLAFRNERA